MVNTGTSSIEIARPSADVWAAITDVTRMGEWSPECVAGRWVDGATGPATGARFEGDNVAKVAGLTVKRWTTTSVVTECEPGRLFEFVAEELTTWRYGLETVGNATRVTESFAYQVSGFVGRVLYDGVLRRESAMTKGMHRTLGRLKQALEAG